MYNGSLKCQKEPAAAEGAEVWGGSLHSKALVCFRGLGGGGFPGGLETVSSSEVAWPLHE